MASADMKRVRISLRKRLSRIHETRRLRKATDYLRERVSKLAKVSPEKVKVHKDLNNMIVKRAGKNMSDIYVDIVRENDAVTAKLSALKEEKSPEVTVPSKGEAKEKSGAPHAKEKK